jgi:type II secretory pathway component PulM
MNFLTFTIPELSRRLTRAETELAEERTRFRQVENILEDIRRESKTPTVIPLLLSALIED